MKYELVVKKVGRTFAVVDAVSGVVVEGGFFERSAAVEARDEIARDAFANEVEKAERAAGWDPNP